MTKFRLLTAGLIAAAMLAAPVAAREHHPSARQLAEGADVSAPSAPRYIGGRICYPAPRVDAFAGQPWDNDIPCEPGPIY